MAGAAVLGVHLITIDNQTVRVGTLTRDAAGATSFVVDEAYLKTPDRPILSLSWFVPADDAASQTRLANRGDKIGLYGFLPPWFSGLLPEGALRDLVISEMGAGNHDHFDLIARLGADLPGAILVVPETDLPASIGPIRFERVHGFRAPEPEGVVKFSLAGVQLKFTANAEGERLTVPGREDDNRYILKLPSERFPRLPEAEMAAMTVARMAKVNTAHCRLICTKNVEGIPEDFLKHGDTILSVERFDRAEKGRRIHIEDAAQIVGAVGERKYTMANYESVLNTIKRFSTDWRIDIMEGFRRAVVDVLIGNGDNHLKNWSFIFPGPGEIRLSPAYDIVPTVLYVPKDTLALPFAGTHSFDKVTFKRIARIASYLGLDDSHVVNELRTLVKDAHATWPAVLSDILGEEWALRLIERFETLALVKDAVASL